MTPSLLFFEAFVFKIKTAVFVTVVETFDLFLFLRSIFVFLLSDPHRSPTGPRRTPAIPTRVRTGPRATAWTRTSTALVPKATRGRRANGSKRSASPPRVKVSVITRSGYKTPGRTCAKNKNVSFGFLAQLLIAAPLP